MHVQYDRFYTCTVHGRHAEQKACRAAHNGLRLNMLMSTSAEATHAYKSCSCVSCVPCGSCSIVHTCAEPILPSNARCRAGVTNDDTETHTKVWNMCYGKNRRATHDRNIKMLLYLLAAAYTYALATQINMYKFMLRVMSWGSADSTYRKSI